MISSEDVCCSVVFGTLVGVIVLLVALCGHQCTSVIKWSVRLHLR